MEHESLIELGEGINSQFEKWINEEINICGHAYPNGCFWGECKKCGVLLLLLKLETGHIEEENVQETRDTLIKNRAK